jgi:hypothetical protein
VTRTLLSSLFRIRFVVEAVNTEHSLPTWKELAQSGPTKHNSPIIHITIGRACCLSVFLPVFASMNVGREMSLRTSPMLSIDGRLRPPEFRKVDATAVHQAVDVVAVVAGTTTAAQGRLLNHRTVMAVACSTLDDEDGLSSSSSSSKATQRIHSGEGSVSYDIDDRESHSDVKERDEEAHCCFSSQSSQSNSVRERRRGEKVNWMLPDCCTNEKKVQKATTRPTARKAVRFHPFPTIVARSKSCRMSWYTRHELAQMKRAARASCIPRATRFDSDLSAAHQQATAELSASSPLSSGPRSAVRHLLRSPHFRHRRGLERWCTTFHAHSRGTHVLVCRVNVFIEQSSQLIRGRDDCSADDLARVCQCASQPAVLFAHAMALADHDVMSESFSYPSVEEA